MKKVFSVFAALAIVAAFASCQKEANPESETKEISSVSIVASMQQEAQSKVGYTDNGTKLITTWEVGDVVVGTINGTTKATFQVTEVREEGKSALLTTTATLNNNDVVKVIYINGVTETSAIDASGNVAVDLNMSTSLKSVKAIMYASGTVADNSLVLNFANKMSIVGFTLDGINSGTSAIKSVLYGDDIYSKASINLATGAVTGNTVADIVCEDAVTISSNKTTQKVYAAIVPGATNFNVVVKNNLLRCYRYSTTRTGATVAGKYYYITDRTASEFPVFSINNANGVAEFAPGNLQYVHPGTYRFAANQWTVFRGTSGNVKNIRYATGDVIDLFSWSTNAVEGHIYGLNVFGVGAFTGALYDWGNAVTGSWRTLSQAEWQYIFTNTTNRSWRYAYATVAGVQGVMVSPNYTTGSVSSANPTAAFNYASNTYTASSFPLPWLFLPTGDFRARTSDTAANVYHSNNGANNHDGGYWSSTTAPDVGTYKTARIVNFSASKFAYDHQSNMSEGVSVRLVHVF